MSKKPKYIRYQIARYFWGAASWFLETVSYLPFLSRIRKETITVTSERIPAAFDGFSIALLSDLHGHFFGKKQERLIEAVKRVDPDIVVMAGDWVREEYTLEDKKAIDALIEGLAPHFPFYGSMGNHETYMGHRKELKKKLEDNGGTFLIDESVLIKKEGTDEAIRLTGLDTYFKLVDRFAPPEAEEAAKEAVMSEYREAMEHYRDPKDKGHGDVYTIVLGHRPEILDVYANLGMDLVLSGHAHGGLMRLWKGKRLLAPDQGLFPTLTHGVHQKDRTTMIISEGLGGPRILIFPQVIKVVLKSAKDLPLTKEGEKG